PWSWLAGFSLFCGTPLPAGAARHNARAPAIPPLWPLTRRGGGAARRLGPGRSPSPRVRASRGGGHVRFAPALRPGDPVAPAGLSPRPGSARGPSTAIGNHGLVAPAPVPGGAAAV